MNEVYGYVRVSARDQNEHRQMIAMSEYEIPSKNIYIDKESGKDFNRKRYKKLIKRIKEGDLIYIKSIDRLGRNYEEIIEQWRMISKTKKADICVIDMPLLDTRRGKDLMGTFISDIVLEILSFVAHNEREVILQRQKEGIEAAKARGVRFGRPTIPLPDKFEEAYQLWIQKKATIEKAAKLCGMKDSTFYYKARLLREATKNMN
ncbi:MAG: recombinase family protein [Solobacterium sp.]|nr:recombinase family protein [Solobacterium sp.]